MSEIQIGNADIDSKDTRSWLIGNFIEEKFGLRYSNDVELKWDTLKAEAMRDKWATGEVRTSIGILISGKFIMQFPDREVVLNKPGDYVMWGPDTDHKWYAPEDCTWLTIRWLSIT